MELLFLDRATMRLKDHAFIGDSWELIIDMVVTQKSSFNLNTTSLDAEIGDLAILKEPGINFIGVVESITSNNDKTIKVQLFDFKELFDMKVPVTSYTGELGTYLAGLIKTALINSTDNRQNLTYLTIVNNACVEGSLIYEENKIINIKDVIEELARTHHIIIKYKVGFIRGRFSSITILIEEMKKSIKLRHDLKAISEVSITDSNQYSTNKVIFYPKAENELHLDTITYYLLKDTSVTTDPLNPYRYNYVKLDCSYYGDSDYELLESKAIDLMHSSTKEHQITFQIAMDNRVFLPLANLYLGYRITFIGKSKTYDTYLTQIKFKNNFSLCYLTLGEYRSSLTDKIKLLTKNKIERNIETSKEKLVISMETIDGGDF